MRLYNMINGVNPSAFYILPSLGKHPDEYPRFRDCGYDGNIITVLTRTGGGNREDYEQENQALCDMPTFITDSDLKEDNTFATWEFAVPEQWKADIDLIVGGEFAHISAAYLEQMKRVFPKLADKFQDTYDEANKPKAEVTTH